MINTNRKSKCCGAPLLTQVSPRDYTCHYVCSKCNEPTDAVSEYRLPEIEVTPDTDVFCYSWPTTFALGEKPTDTVSVKLTLRSQESQANYYAEQCIKYQTRISELENEVAILRAKNI